jgi:micrococcal nuclease
MALVGILVLAGVSVFFTNSVTPPTETPRVVRLQQTPSSQVASASPAGATITGVTAYYPICGSPPHSNCVIDGDTFYHGRQSIRVADIDTPETRGAKCSYEANLGQRATRRFQQLLSEGPFELHGWGSRDEDRYGRKLRVVVRNGRSLGDILVAEGLARTWTGRREPWC